MANTKSTISYSLTVSELKGRANSDEIRVLNAGKGDFWACGEMQGPVSKTYDKSKEAQFAVFEDGTAVLCNAGNGATLQYKL